MGQQVFINVVLFVIGLVLLVKGSDFFVKSAASIAKKLGVSEFVIGLTLVAVGTSIPELVSSIIASIKQQSGIVIGNIVGSNIANIGLIIGLAATIRLIKTKQEMLKRDGYIMLFAAVLFCLFILDGSISRIEGGLLLLLYIAYSMFLFGTKSGLKGKYGFKEFISYFFKFRYLTGVGYRVASGLSRRKDNKTKKKQVDIRMIKDLLVLVISGSAIAFGANYFVSSAIFFANFFKIPPMIIGATIVSFGTTLPEFSVTVSASRRGYGNIAIGNVIGSNIANILLILGVSGLIFPLSVIKLTVVYAAPFLIFMSVLLLLFIRSNWEIRRLEGATFLGLYILFIVFLFLINLHLN